MLQLTLNRTLWMRVFATFILPAAVTCPVSVCQSFSKDKSFLVIFYVWSRLLAERVSTVFLK